MKLSAIIAVALTSWLANAAIIPVGSPNGIYTFHANESGHEVMTYHGPAAQPRNLPVGNSLSAREHLSALAAARARAAPLEERQEPSITCGPYTGLNYGPATNDFANWCGISQSFSGYIAEIDDGAIFYACDYGNGNWCDHDHVLQFGNQISAWCGPNANGWTTISNYALAFGRTQAGTCFCSC